MDRPPQVGKIMPRAADAWCADRKWTHWILAEHGHGPEWRRVFDVGPDGWRRTWDAIAEAVRRAPVTEVRVGSDGVGCGVVVELSIGQREATAVSAWHYADEGAAPRLVTAYPRPYNRGHGNA
jgi:hypothetical protein